MLSRLRFLTAGESHGPAVSVLLDGVPAGLALRAEQIDEALSRRQRGYGRGGRMKIEHDRVQFEGGVRLGETLGGPIAMRVENRDFANWAHTMGAAPGGARVREVTSPRPGHADLAGALKFDRYDARDVLERASARETAARVAAGAVARVLLEALEVRVGCRVVAVAGVVDAKTYSCDEVLAEQSRLDASLLRVIDPERERAMQEAVRARAHEGETAGGVIEVCAAGLPPGLGSFTQWDRRLDARLGFAALSVPAIKAVELGDGWASAALAGAQAHDPIGYDRSQRSFTRASNHAGGVEGGTSNGQPIVLRAAMKPLSTLRAGLASVDLRTKEPTSAAHERSDVCAVPAAAVVLEAMVALVLADALLEKTGGDSLREVRRNLDGYRAQVHDY